MAEEEVRKAVERNGSRVAASTNTGRVVCFRIDDDLNRRISRALAGKPWTRSDFIRNAIDRVLKQDAEERLRAAHSAIRWE
jgi:predicted transcriptional regulator